jgi:hypothetical protein
VPVVWLHDLTEYDITLKSIGRMAEHAQPGAFL